MTALGLSLALGLASPSLRISVDRSFLPAEAGEDPPVAHVAARGAREVEVSLFELRQPLRAFLGMPSVPPAPGRTGFSPQGWGRELREDCRRVWSSLGAPARAVTRQLLGAASPLALALPGAGDLPAVDGRLLRAFRVPLTDTGWNYQDLALGTLGPGLYALDAEAGGARASALLSVSRLDLLAEGTSEGTSILASDAVQGRPLGGVELFALPADPHGFPVSLGKTGPSGLWTSGKAISGPVVGRWEGQLARVSLPDVPGRTEVGRWEAGAVFLDRASYAPGDSVRVWCLLRDREAGAWKIPEDEDARLQLVDSTGTVLLQQTAEISALGVVEGAVVLPRGLPEGWYGLAVLWGQQVRSAGLRIAPEWPPELQVRWQLPPWSPPAHPLDGAITVLDRLGRPAPGVAVHWSAVTDELSSSPASPGPAEPLGDGAGISGADGRLAIRLPSGPRGTVRLRASAVDSAERTAAAVAEVPRVAAPLLLDVVPERRVVRPDHAVQLSLEAQALGDEPLRGPLQLSIVSAHSTPGGESVRTPLPGRTVELDARGHASVTLPGAPAGYLDVQAGLAGSAEPLARTTVFVTETGGDIPTTPDRLELVLDRRDYARGDEARVLILTPFESGTVLLGVEPSAEPADQLVTIHGYSGEARLKVPPAGGSLRVVGAALSGGTLYRAVSPIPIVEHAPPLTLKIYPERGARAGERLGLSVAASDADGHGVPAAVTLWASAEATGAPPLNRLLASAPPAQGWVVGSSAVADSSLRGAGDAPPRWIQPYGPSEPESPGDVTQPTQVVDLSADDSGRATASLRMPAGARRLWLVARAVGGPASFGERSVALPIDTGARISLDSPAWVRAGDRFAVEGQVEGSPDAGCSLAILAGGAAPAASDCSPGGERRVQISGGAEPVLDVSAALPGQKVGAHRSVDVLQPRHRAAATTAAGLAGELAEGLSAGAGDDWPDVDAAAVRALGGLPSAGHDLASVAIARLLARQNPTGGFGPPEGELRRDLASWRGLASLRAQGAFVDAAALSRLADRVGELRPRDAAPPGTPLLLDSGTSGGSRQRLPVAEPPDLDEATALDVSQWLAGHRPTAAGARRLLDRLASLSSTADPLDLGEIAVALAALPGGPTVAPAPPALAVSRRYLLVERKPWTPALLEADEEPGEPALRPVSDSIPLDAEVEVALSADAPGPAHVACLRDFPPAGLAPIGRSVHLPRGLLLCGRTAQGRLDVSYHVRAVRAGRFVAPGPVASLSSGPGPASWVEIAP